MALSSQQLTYLKTADQRFTAHVVLFPAYSPTITTPNPGNGTALALKPMPLVSPRYSVVANSGEITLYATDSYNRGGAYVGNDNIAWVNTGAAGTLVDNEDGTATYTAPAEGAGTNLITMTATNGNGTKDALCYVAYPKTTYDALVAEVVSISGGASQNGWAITFRVRGDTTDFAIGKIVLLHIEDTWAGTTSTFGGYKYAEGVFCGYITQMDYYENGLGERWLGVVAQSSWSKLEKIQISETMWGQTARVGRYYISDFRPVDALWYLLSETTDFCSRHNCTLFYDTNVIDDFIIGRGTENSVSLAEIIKDVMARGLAIAYTDRYSSLLCIPDPDVRSLEWWGTPSPVYDGSEPLTKDCCYSYNVRKFDVPAVRRLALVAFDSYRLGMWAVSQASAGTQGTEEIVKGLLCDDTLKLVQWASEKRAQYNKPWDISCDMPLNHTLDLYNPVICIFTSPSQQGGATASGLCWLDSVSYRPTVGGSWEGNLHFVKNTQGDTGANGEVSGWGGSGQWGKSGTGIGIAPSGWSAPAQGSVTFAHTANFQANYGGWNTHNVSAEIWPDHNTASALAWSNVPGIWITGVGWSGITATGLPPVSTSYYTVLRIERPFAARTITSLGIYYSAPTADYFTFWVCVANAGGDVATAYAEIAAVPAGEESVLWSGTETAANIYINLTLRGSIATAYTSPGFYIESAIVRGIGTDPFG